MIDLHFGQWPVDHFGWPPSKHFGPAPYLQLGPAPFRLNQEGVRARILYTRLKNFVKAAWGTHPPNLVSHSHDLRGKFPFLAYHSKIFDFSTHTSCAVVNPNPMT